MDIREFIDKNGKLILQIVIIIVVILLGIKSLNLYYEKQVEIKQEEIVQGIGKEEQTITQEDYTTESNSTEITIASFVSYCNNRELANAYKMLTDECKNAMFPTIEDFEKIYINNIYDVKRNYDLVRWSTDENKITYLITLYEDILATGGTGNSTQEYCTLVEDDNGNYKLNINNYIYGQDLNIEKNVSNIKVQVDHVNIYQEYEELKITITNNTEKTICLTGNENKNNIYLQKQKNMKYVSINSRFDRGEVILLDSNKTRTFNVKFNKQYTPNNMGGELILENIILDYEEYLNSKDKINYPNKASIKISI